MKQLPYRGILCVLALVVAIFLLPQSRPHAQSSGSASPTPNYSYSTPSASPTPSPTPSPGYAANSTMIQSGPVGSFTYSGYLNFKVPVSLSGHSFALQYVHPTNGSLVTSGATAMGVITAPTGSNGAQSALYLAVMAYVPGSPFNQATTDWWLADTTGQLTTPTAHRTLDLTSVPWTTYSGVANRYFAVPDTRAGHALMAGFPGGGWTSVTQGPVFYTYISGSMAPLHYLVCCAPGVGGLDDAHLSLADLNTDEKSTLGKADLRAAGDWAFDPGYGTYPNVHAIVTLAACELGHVFTVHSAVAGMPDKQVHVAATSPAGGTTTSVLDFQVGSGLYYWITRDAENGVTSQPVAPSSGYWYAGTSTGVTLTQSAASCFPVIPKRLVALQPHTFRIESANRQNHIFTVRMTDGYTTSLYPDHSHTDVTSNTIIPAYGADNIAQWNFPSLGTVPISNPLAIYTFTAMVDPVAHPNSAGVILTDDSIPNLNGLTNQVTVDTTSASTDVFDGWVPAQSPAPDPTITIHVPESRLNDTFQLFAQSLPANYYWPQYPVMLAWPTPPPVLETATYPGVDEMADYDLNYYSLTFPNPAPYFGGPFTLQDSVTRDSHDVSAGDVNDLRQWFLQPHAVNLQISTSRTDHHLRIRHPNGEFFEITNPAPAGNSSLGPYRVLNFIPYYYFDATSSARAEMPWYVEDLDTGERIGPSTGLTYPSNDDLIQWTAVLTPGTLTAPALIDGVHLAWDRVEDANGGGFIIERQAVDASDAVISPWQEIDRILDDKAVYIDRNLTWSQTYQYRVRKTFGADAAERHSAPTNVASATTPQNLDTDQDGLPDWWEMQYNNTLAYGANDLNQYGVTMATAFHAGGDPSTQDSDGDGVDNAHDAYPTDPRRSAILPVQSYAAVDSSTPIIGERDVIGTAIDDSGRFAFVSLNPLTMQYEGYVLVNGVASNPIQVPVSPGVTTAEWTISEIDPENPSLIPITPAIYLKAFIEPTFTVHGINTSGHMSMTDSILVTVYRKFDANLRDTQSDIDNSLSPDREYPIYFNSGNAGWAMVWEGTNPPAPTLDPFGGRSANFSILSGLPSNVTRVSDLPYQISNQNVFSSYDYDSEGFWRIGNNTIYTPYRQE